MELAYIYLATICGDDDNEPQGAYGSIDAAIRGIKDYFRDEKFRAELGEDADVELVRRDFQQCDETRSLVTLTFLVEGAEEEYDVYIDRLPFTM